MMTIRKQVALLFVDRASERWIVRDPDGKFWLLPSVPDPWEQREPFHATEDMNLEPVPGHYKNMLGLPF